MAEQTVLVAIDIGTTKVCVLIGEIAERGGVDVIGIGQAPSDGLRKGVVIDIDRTVQSVTNAVDAAERLSGLKVRSAFVGISGSHIGSQNSRGMVAVRHDVDRSDTVRAIEAARAVSIPNTREILHVIPRGYVVDGQEGVRDPIGMAAVRLEVETHIVTASSTSVQNLTKCVQRAGVEIDELVLAPLATAEATLGAEDRELGVVLADIGGDTTDIAIFQDGSISHCALGGDAEVAAERDLEAAAEAVAVDGRDDDLRRLLELAESVVGADDERVLRVEVAFREDRDIRARREESLVRAAHHDRLQGVVAACLLDRGVELVQKALVVRISGRPIKHDVADGILLLETNGQCGPPVRNCLDFTTDNVARAKRATVLPSARRFS
jgi:Ethanolamine utilization protein EutJ (predicted chaperonin)